MSVYYHCLTAKLCHDKTFLRACPASSRGNTAGILSSLFLVNSSVTYIKFCAVCHIRNYTLLARRLSILRCATEWVIFSMFTLTFAKGNREKYAYKICCRKTFVFWWTTGSSRDVSVPRLPAAEFPLQTARRTWQYWCAWWLGSRICKLALRLRSQNESKRGIALLAGCMLVTSTYMFLIEKQTHGLTTVNIGRDIDEVFLRTNVCICF